MSDSLLNVEKNNGSSKTFLVIGIVFLLIMGSTLAFLFLTPTGQILMGKETSTSEIETKKYDLKNITFTTLPEILLNLRSSDGRQVFLKATFVTESASSILGEKVDKLKPMIIDQYQTYLRELDIDDLKGSAGIERIRQELVSRTNSLLAPDKINNVLFKEFLIQ